MTMDPMALRAAVAEGFARQTQWLAQLAAFDSTRGNEAECQDWLAGEFASRGWAVDRYTIDEVDIAGLPGFSPVVDADYSRAVQVVATHEVEAPVGKSLILQGHIDVVPPGAPELWSQDPFRPEIRDGWMHGRGTGDMKAGVSAMVFALDALRRLGYVPGSRVHIETVSEEECTGNGALSTLARGYRADAAFIPESMGHRIIRAELGSVWFRLRILGRPGHVLASASTGSHAILAATAYIEALKGLTAEINAEAVTHPHFGAIADPVKFNPGKIRGGDWLGSVPSWCELECRLSVLPGHSLAQVRERVTEAVRRCAAALEAEMPELSWIGFQADGHVFAPGTAAEALLADIHAEVLGQPLEPLCLTATSDTRFYDLYYGIPALCYGGNARGMHAPSEAVELASLATTTEVIARFVANWCGLKAA
ncbi:ArgE/DapE family deacylase [Devosia sp.]|uniref:ArgE/DapE family deacylase n=1 Tax=Devosia sp. TaxID=1871048 RepID=UPI003F716A1E